jgi:hypothetical protein
MIGGNEAHARVLINAQLADQGLVPTLLERSKMVAFFLDHWAAEFAIA